MERYTKIFDKGVTKTKRLDELETIVKQQGVVQGNYTYAMQTYLYNKSKDL